MRPRCTLHCRKWMTRASAVGMIYLDNYEEALESVEEVRRSLLIALIDRKVNKYIASLDGISKKLEKDKYLVIMRKKAVAQLQESRFDLLEEVKTVNIGNEMAVTISIGIGLDGLTYAQNYEFARTAIDLALGRGGDQAVIKTPESITYYGGKSQQVEKNTRVKARVKAHALREIITGKDRVIVMGHRMPDVDSFGSAVGIYRIAQTLGRKAHIVLNEATTSVQPLVELFKNNPEYDEDMIITSQQAIDMAGSNTVLVVVDVNKPSITECPDLLALLQIRSGTGPPQTGHGDHRECHIVLCGALCILGLRDGIRDPAVHLRQYQDPYGRGGLYVLRYHDRYQQLYDQDRCPHLRGCRIPAQKRRGCDPSEKTVP